MKRGWNPAPPGYKPVGPYGLKFPIQKLEKPWVVIDECWSPDLSEQKLLKVKLHDDQDDPDHKFLGPEAWFLWPNKKTLSLWYNHNYTKSIRMKRVRSASYDSEQFNSAINEDAAEAALYLQDLILSDPTTWHATESIGFVHMDWSPSGLVWKNGKPWVVIPAAAAKEAAA